MEYKCRVCIEGEADDPDTSYISNAEPDDDWEAQSDRLIEQMQAHAEERELIPTVTASVVVHNGEMFVPMWDVHKSIGRRLTDTDLFRIGRQVFEVLEYIFPTREYLVRPFSMELTEEDLSRLAGP